MLGHRRCACRPVLVVDDPGVLRELTWAALSCLRALAVARKYTHGIRVR